MASPAPPSRIDHLRSISHRIHARDCVDIPARSLKSFIENISHVFVLSEKRDAVGTAQLGPTGKMTGLAVLEGCCDQSMGQTVFATSKDNVTARSRTRSSVGAQSCTGNSIKALTLSVMGR